ncbi:MAG: nickel transporter [Chlamydiae bacterium CG10_big_fil_rev_8_21_14_0_10_42_34]|nr:MAG: nickel transporter [Chlamydiae bacterium CG10_big_fil_rev_8_21_14_0_10_42_34]
MDASLWIEFLYRTLPLLAMGAVMTLKVLVCGASISFVLGIVFGVVCCEEIKIPYISPIIEFITFVLRAVPFFVQLLIVYFVVPDLIGIDLEVFSASILAIGLCSAGYVCQIVRAGINSIHVSQWEAAFALGYNKVKTLFYIILPQMFRNVLPAFNNEFESMLKSTAILSSIGMLELTRMGMNMVSRELKQPLAIYLLVALFYVAMSVVLNFVAKYFERALFKKVKA